MPEAAKEWLLQQWEYCEGKARRAWASGEKTSAGTHAVKVPHCWNAEDTFLQDKGYRRGWGSYRIELESEQPPAGAAYLISEGFFGVGDVWINGSQVLADGEHTGATPGQIVRPFI